MTTAESPAIALPGIALLRVTGTDAREFLQAQLSRGIDDLSPAQSALAGWHDARGRVRAVFRVLLTDEGFLLAASADLIEQLSKTLSMFVLRADVAIEIADLACAGMLASDANTPPRYDDFPDLPQNVNEVACRDGLLAVCVAPGLWHIIGPGNELRLSDNTDYSPILAAEIRAGLPQVDQRTTLQYVPHMLNLDKLGALDFDKGCYPGQEIIARTENLGSVKRRAQALTAEATPEMPYAPESGAPVVDAAGERVGSVLRAARTADKTLVLLAVVALDARDNAMFLESTDGPRLTRTALPFDHDD